MVLYCDGSGELIEINVKRVGLKLDLCRITFADINSGLKYACILFYYI